MYETACAVPTQRPRVGAHFLAPLLAVSRPSSTVRVPGGDGVSGAFTGAITGFLHEDQELQETRELSSNPEMRVAHVASKDAGLQRLRLRVNPTANLTVFFYV